MKSRSHSVRERLSDRLFDSGGFTGRANSIDDARRPNYRTPTVNVSQRQDFYELEVAVPGYRKEDLSIEVQNQELTVKGNSSKRTMQEGPDLLRMEHNINEFSRTFELDEDMDPKKIEATYDSGVLHIKLNKKNGKISLAPAKIRVPIQ